MTCYVAHSQTVDVDDVIQRIHHHNESKRVQINEPFHQHFCRHKHAVAVQQASERAHLHANEHESKTKGGASGPPARLAALAGNG